MSIESSQISPTLRFIALEVEGNGACLFHSLGMLLGLDATELRRIICDFIAEQPALFSHFMDGESLEDYIGRMGLDDTWGGNLELTATAMLYNVRIIIVHGARRIPIGIEEANPEHTILLQYTGNHYRPIFWESSSTFDGLFEADFDGNTITNVTVINDSSHPTTKPVIKQLDKTDPSLFKNPSLAQSITAILSNLTRFPAAPWLTHFEHEGKPALKLKSGLTKLVPASTDSLDVVCKRLQSGRLRLIEKWSEDESSLTISDTTICANITDLFQHQATGQTSHTTVASAFREWLKKHGHTRFWINCGCKDTVFNESHFSTGFFIKNVDDSFYLEPLKSGIQLTTDDLLILPVSMHALLPGNHTRCPVIPWPCHLNEGELAIQDPTVIPVSQDDPIVNQHGEDFMEDEKNLFRAVNFARLAYSHNIHDPVVPLVGSTGVGKSLAARRACDRFNLQAKTIAAYICLPRIRDGSLLATWPPTSDQHMQMLTNIFQVDSDLPPQLIMTHWVRASEALIVAMLHHRTGSVTDGFDHLNFATHVYATTQSLLRDYTLLDLAQFTNQLIKRYSELSDIIDNHSAKNVVFIDEIGLFLTNVSSALPAISNHLSSEYPRGRPLSVLRAIRHAGRNLAGAGLLVVIVPLGTAAGALDCHDYPTELECYRSDPEDKLPFEYEVLKSSVVFPPCIIRGPVAIQTTSKMSGHMDMVHRELIQTYPGENIQIPDCQRLISSRALWPSYLARSDRILDWMDSVESKIRDVVASSPKGSFGLLLAGLGPNLSSEFSTQLLRHGIARVSHHPLAFTFKDGIVHLNLTEKHQPLRLVNPRDPLAANTYWRLVQTRDNHDTCFVDLLEWLRSHLSLPFGASGLGVTFGEPLGILHLLHARVQAENFHQASIFTLPQVSLASIANALTTKNQLIGYDLGLWSDVNVSFTHVVDLPTTIITVDTLRNAYIDGVMFRMPSGTAYIDYLAVGVFDGTRVLVGIQVRTGNSSKELVCKFPTHLEELLDVQCSQLNRKYLLVSLCATSTNWTNADDDCTGYLHLKSDCIDFLYTAAEERRHGLADRHMFVGDRIMVKIQGNSYFQEYNIV
eukprot:gnl/Dysnectes_brevis/1059_a1180_2880.p1 GENE.gnl/Dysnectes_brevis/1059_a1180_2880~~gnl/Dysnectes_brevis/1059_a1180_2880.p1  ORF type:complete len:1085 (+),score=89.84 gnl/Dysnectes_brevis/1059_a1180_2880:174-3428(+)